MKPSLLILSFMDYAFDILCIKSPLHPSSSSFFPLLSSRSFIVLHSTFRFVIHFEFIFVEGTKSVSRFIFFPFFFYKCGFPFLPAPVVEETIFALLHYLCSLIKDQLMYIGWYIYGLFILFHWSVCLFFHQHHTILITVAL